MSTNSKLGPLESGTDELERLSLEEVVRRARFGASPACFIIPAGRGSLACDMARLGATVVAADQADCEQDIVGRALAGGFRDEIRFTEAAFENFPDTLPDQPFDIIFCRRGLSNLPYYEAAKLIRHLLSKLKIGGKLYLSLLGKHSELGDGYPDSDKFVAERFAQLNPALAKKYGITNPLCLYSERDLFILLLEAGGSVLRTFTSTHGNVKGVAVRV